MTRGDKKLLLKDLCARLPYGVKVKVVLLHSEEYTYVNAKLVYIDLDYTGVLSDNGFVLQQDISEVKPYLFPLSSMTEEQKVIYGDLCYAVIRSLAWDTQTALNELIEWLNKNHFDYRGLIPLGLANDASNLNIY